MAYNFCQTNQDSTVSNAILYVYGFTLPLVVIAIVEFIGRSVLPKIGLLKIEAVKFRRSWNQNYKAFCHNWWCTIKNA